MSANRALARTRLGAPVVVLFLAVLTLVAATASPAARSGCAQMASSLSSLNLSSLNVSSAAVVADVSAAVSAAPTDRDVERGAAWAALIGAGYLTLAGAGLLWLGRGRAGPGPLRSNSRSSLGPRSGRLIPLDRTMLGILRV